LEEARGEASPKGFREHAHDGFDPIVKGVEERVLHEATLAVHRGAVEPVAFQHLPHLAVGPLLKMETLERVSEMDRDIVRAREAMRGIEDVDASRFEKAINRVKMQINIFRMKVFEELVAKGEVGAAVG